MDKLMEEEDLKGLEEEIDNAVDRLFVERKRNPEERLLMESPVAEPGLKPSTLEPPTRPPVLESIKPQPFEPSIPSPDLESFLMESPLTEPALKPSRLKPSTRPTALESPIESQPFEPSVPSPDLDLSLMESPLTESPLRPSALEPSTRPPVLESRIESQPIEASIQSAILEPSVKSSLLEPSYEFEKSLDEERPLHPSIPSASPFPVPFLKAIERMEAQLLSLEWEITREKLEKTKEEVLALKELVKQKANVTAVLGSMENIVDQMIKKEEDIRPPWIKFLLDSKETLKLLMRKETGGEIDIYKQLAYLGLEARFSCLEGMKDPKIGQPLPKEAVVQGAGLSISGEQKIGEMSKSIDIFMNRAEEIFGTIQQQILKLEETSRKLPAPFLETKSPSINITIFKIDERLFGVESEKVFKLFKVPTTFEEKYSDQQKIRLKDFEVKMIDLKKPLSLQEKPPKEKIRILTIKENGEYKGFMVDEVVKRVSILFDRREEADGYYSGVVPFTYHEQALEIPILDLKKF